MTIFLNSYKSLSLPSPIQTSHCVFITVICSYCMCFPQLDVLVHRLVILLADIGDSKSVEGRVSDANLACRKLAVSHPVLLLRWTKTPWSSVLYLVHKYSPTVTPLFLNVFPRHLPMIASLLHGRIHLNFQEFRQQNHMTFFSNVLAILELLQPLVFHSEHQRALQDCLLSFMKVLRVGGSDTVSSSPEDKDSDRT